MMSNNTAKLKLVQTIEMINGAYAPSTIRAYKSNYESFIRFCDEKNECAFPAKSDLIANYVKNLSDGHLRSASIRIAIAAISAIHRLNDLPDPTQHSTVKIEMRRMHRNLGRESKQAYGITADLLDQMLAHTDDSTIGERNKTILMVAYDSMCRRSELVSLRIEDIWHQENRIKIRLRKSKTDQFGQGKIVTLSENTSIQLVKWLNILNDDVGYIFRGLRGCKFSEKLNPSQINRIYKKTVHKLSLAEEVKAKISGHSTRVGGAQDLLKNGANLVEIMNKGRWTKVDTVMRYLELASTV